MTLQTILMPTSCKLWSIKALKMHLGSLNLIWKGFFTTKCHLPWLNSSLGSDLRCTTGLTPMLSALTSSILLIPWIFQSFQKPLLWSALKLWLIASMIGVLGQMKMLSTWNVSRVHLLMSPFTAISQSLTTKKITCSDGILTSKTIAGQDTVHFTLTSISIQVICNMLFHRWLVNLMNSDMIYHLKQDGKVERKRSQKLRPPMV